MVKEFVIPVEKDELLVSHAGFYNVEEIVPLRGVPQALDATRTALQTNGASFILDHFDTFFSVMVHGNKMEIQITVRTFNRIMKAIETLINHMEKIHDSGNEMDNMEKRKYLCINKMFAYLFSWFICHIEERVQNQNTTDIADIGKRKKSKRSDMQEEWDDKKQEAMELVYRWLQLPLQNLWQPPIIEENFVLLFTNMCYKMLEQCKNSREGQIKQTIFEVLGTLVKKYGHRISFVIRIIQLVKLHDTLAVPLAAGIVRMVTECGCKGLLNDIVNEINQSDLGEIGSRNIAIFLENLATNEHNLLTPVISDIFDHLESEYYTMRNCVIGILGTVVEKSLTGENLTEKQKELRDECLNNLEDHILDCNAYVRSKVLQTWQHLCCEGAVPLSRYAKLLSMAALRLEDKSGNVRKQALQLLRAFLETNPFAGKLSRTEFTKLLEMEKAKLRELQANIAKESARGDKQRLELWNELLPEIQIAIKEIIVNNKEEDEEEDEEKENSDNQDNEEITDAAFETVRQLMLDQKVSDAVTHLWKICKKLRHLNIENLSSEKKEECIFLFLLKIFMESENVSDFANTNVCNMPTENPANESNKSEMEKLKRMVSYLKDCLEVATEMENALPMVENLLFSTTPSDAVEACTFIGTACQFGIAGSGKSIRKALFQAFHRDQSVRNNVASMYKELYLNDDKGKKTDRQKALVTTQHLVDLLLELEPGQSPALEQLIGTWYTNKEISNDVLQVLWEKFSMKSSETVFESRAALMLLTMIAQAEDTVISGNLDVLIKVGLGPQAKTDLLLARDTCRALLKITHNKDIHKPQLRFDNDHDMFKSIMALLTEHFGSMKKDGYVSFATDAINVIYRLANQPDQLVDQLLLYIMKERKFTKEKGCCESLFILSKLLYVVGHIAIMQMVHLDISVYKELKRRNALLELKKGKKNKSRKSRPSIIETPNSVRETLRIRQTSIEKEDNGEEAVEGAMDDADAEFINAVLENEIVSGDGMLAKFVPLVLDVCQYPEKYKHEEVQAAGILVLSKMMTVSSVFCEEHLQLLVTILERSPYPKIRGNVLIALSDLAIRFPNQVDPWTQHLYGRLHDKNKSVRRTCVRILSNLILKEMIRVKGQISELTFCIVDKEPEIQQMAKSLFHELSQKGNALYNVIPDILSRLADPNLNLEGDDFQEIVKFILGLVHKEKQVHTIIDKICGRFMSATTERQCCDLAFCLSLLQFNAKSIRRLLECLPLLKDKLHYKQVLKTIQNIIEQTKKKPEAKAACIELEEKINEFLEGAENSEMTDSQAMPPPPAPAPKRRRTRRIAQRKSSSEEDDSSDSDSEAPVARTRKGKNAKRKAQVAADSSSSSDSENEAPNKALQDKRSGSARKKTIVTPSSSRSKRNRRASSTSDRSTRSSLIHNLRT